MSAQKFEPRHCQFCGAWIERQVGRGRPRLFCNRRCHYARSVADGQGMISLKISDLVPLLSSYEVMGRIFQRSGHPGCAAWLLRLAQTVHRDTGSYLRFGDFLRWLEGQEYDLSKESTYLHGGLSWTDFKKHLGTLVARWS